MEKKIEKINEKINENINEEKMFLQLIEAAKKGRKNAYAPYSGFAVGAAVLGTDGKIYTGCNIENASYGLTVCAERTAMFKMVSEGCPRFRALCVIAGEKPSDSSPCGACRQVMSEFAEDVRTVPVILAGRNGEYEVHTVLELYPEPFMKFEP